MFISAKLDAHTATNIYIFPIVSEEELVWEDGEWKPHVKLKLTTNSIYYDSFPYNGIL